MNKNVGTSLLWLGLIVGGLLGWLAWQDWQIASLGTPQPEDITLNALAQRGVSGNVHLRVSKFRVGDNFVYELKGSTWNRVWVPLYGNDNKIHLLIKSYKLKSAADVNAFAQQGSVTGILTNSIHSLGSAEKEKLEKAYSGIDFTSLPILEQEKTYPGATKRMLMVGGSIVGLLVGLAGVGILIAARRRGS